MPHSESKELTQAKNFIDECKHYKAHQILENFEEKGDHTLHDIVLCHLLKCQLFYWQGLYENVIKLAKKTYKESLGLGKNFLSVDILLIRANALVWLGPWDKHDIIIQGEEILKSLPQKLSVAYRQREAYIAFLKGWFYAQTYDTDQALKQFELSLSLREELGAKPEIALSLIGIALIFMVKGNFNRALKYSKQSITVAEESDNKWCIGYSSMCMALIHNKKGEFDRSIILFEWSLTIFKDLNNNFMVAWIFNNMGTAYEIRGELDSSIRFYEQALELFKELNNKRRMAGVYNNLSENYRMKGEFDHALDCIEQSLALFHESGNLRNIVGVYDFLIQILINKGDLERAQQSLNDLEQMKNELNDKQFNLMYLLDKAIILKTSPRVHNRSKAEKILKQILKEKDLNYELTIKALTNLCELLLIELRITNDLEVLEEITPLIARLLDIADKSHSYSILCETYLLQAKLSLLTLDTKKSQQFLTQAQQIAEGFGLKLLAIKISNEHDELLKQIEMWEKLKESKAPLSERMKLAKLNDQMERMIRKREIVIPELSNEEPVFLLIVSEGGRPVFSQSFREDQSFEDHLFGGFFTAINSFIREKFSEGLDRAIFGEHTLLMNSVSPFFVCYIFKGQSYLAQQRVRAFIDKIQDDKLVWQTFKIFHQSNKEIQPKDIPSLDPLIKEIFIERTISLPE